MFREGLCMGGMQKHKVHAPAMRIFVGGVWERILWGAKGGSAKKVTSGIPVLQLRWRGVRNSNVSRDKEWGGALLFRMVN